MIKRNRRNIGKEVAVQYPGDHDWNGKKGWVVGFRGDFGKGDPNVNVFLFLTQSVWTIPGSFLRWTGRRK